MSIDHDVDELGLTLTSKSKIQRSTTTGLFDDSRDCLTEESLNLNI